MSKLIENHVMEHILEFRKLVPDRWFKNTTKSTKPTKPLPRLICQNGLSFSVQASENHYCAPKKDNCTSYTPLSRRLDMVKTHTQQIAAARKSMRPNLFDSEFSLFCDQVASILGVPHLDGTQWVDGFSIDCALDYFESGQTTEEAAALFRASRASVLDN